VTVFNSLFPVFAVIALGFGLTRIGFIQRELQVGLNALAYWIGLPSLLFYKIASAEFEAGPAGSYFIVLLLGTFASFAVGIVTARALKLPGPSAGSFIQACFRGNLAYVALAIITFYLASLPEVSPERANQILTSVIFALVPCVIIYNIVSVAVLEICARAGTVNGAALLRATVRNILLNPLVIGCVMGLIVQQAGLVVPLALDRTCEIIANAAFPMALLGIGSQLARTPLGGQLKPAMISSLIKITVPPLAGGALAWQLGLRGPELKAALVLLATPTAVATYVLADQMNCDARLAAGSVVVCTLMSFASLWLILAI